MPYNDVSHPELITKSAAVVVSYTREMYTRLVSLFPTPEEYSEDHSRFEASYAASLKGDPELAKVCEADRNTVNRNLSILRGLAKVASIKDPTVPELLGLGQTQEKTVASLIPLVAPHDFRVFYDPKGQILASVLRVAGAKGYQIWACDGDPNIDANWRLATSSTNCKNIMITGLNRGKNNWLKIRAIRGNTTGPWSNYVNLTPV